MPSIGARMVRAVFCGATIGIFGGTGLYLLARAVNLIAGATVVPEPGFLLLGLGGALVGAIAVELSADLSDTKQS